MTHPLSHTVSHRNWRHGVTKNFNNHHSESDSLPLQASLKSISYLCVGDTCDLSEPPPLRLPGVLLIVGIPNTCENVNLRDSAQCQLSSAAGQYLLELVQQQQQQQLVAGSTKC